MTSLRDKKSNRRGLYITEDDRLQVSPVQATSSTVLLCQYFCKWLKVEFLGYLEKWENYVVSVPNLSKRERQRIMLSKETISGWKMTGGIKSKETSEAKKQVTPLEKTSQFQN